MAVFVFRLGKGTEKGGGMDRPAIHRPPTKKKTLNILFFTIMQAVKLYLFVA
jgi:hypothetical protein